MDYVNLYRNAVTYYGVFEKFDEQDCESLPESYSISDPLL